MERRVLLADDHGMLRRGLVALLQEQLDLTVVGEAENGRQAVALCREKRPHIVILDLSMPEMSGILAAEQIKGIDQSIKIIALSMYTDAQLVRQMLAAGASAYVLKVGVFEELMAAIAAVLNGQRYLSPQIADTVISDYLHILETGHTERPIDLLSLRERQVMQLIAEGLSTKEIAYRLKQHAKTIDSHRRNIMVKLGLSSLADLIKLAIREGLTSID